MLASICSTIDPPLARRACRLLRGGRSALRVPRHFGDRDGHFLHGRRRLLRLQALLLGTAKSFTGGAAQFLRILAHQRRDLHHRADHLAQIVLHAIDRRGQAGDLIVRIHVECFTRQIAFGDSLRAIHHQGNRAHQPANRYLGHRRAEQSAEEDEDPEMNGLKVIDGHDGIQVVAGRLDQLVYDLGYGVEESGIVCGHGALKKIEGLSCAFAAMTHGKLRHSALRVVERAVLAQQEIHLLGAHNAVVGGTKMCDRFERSPSLRPVVLELRPVSPRHRRVCAEQDIGLQR
jgi:hypothetical protein